MNTQKYKYILSFLLIGGFTALLSACDTNHSTDTANSTVTVEKPFTRSTPPGQKVAGAFMLLKNNTAADIDLIQASSNVSGITEIHETSMQNGVMKMQHIGKITIPAHGSAELKPGGLHIMLMQLQQQLKEGAVITINLKFSDQSSQTIEVPVIKATSSMMHTK